MIEFVAFRPQHLTALRLQAWQANVQPDMTEEFGRSVLEQDNGRAFSALLEGRAIACGGAFEIWPGRAYAWSFLSDDALRHIKAVHRYALKVFARAPWARIEAYCDARHDAGARWLEHLGFEFECVARRWAMDGRDMRQYARVR